MKNKLVLLVLCFHSVLNAQVQYPPIEYPASFSFFPKYEDMYLYSEKSLKLELISRENDDATRSYEALSSDCYYFEVAWINNVLLSIRENRKSDPYNRYFLIGKQIKSEEEYNPKYPQINITYESAFAGVNDKDYKTIPIIYNYTVIVKYEILKHSGKALPITIEIHSLDKKILYVYNCYSW